MTPEQRTAESGAVNHQTQIMAGPDCVKHIASLARQAIQSECLVAKSDGGYLREDQCERIIEAAINAAISLRVLSPTEHNERKK